MAKKKEKKEASPLAKRDDSILQLPAITGMGAIEALVNECSLAQDSAKNRIERAMILATGMKQLRAMISNEMMNLFMELQGSSLGFKTDKAYPAEILKDAIIEALLRGVNVVGNEFNVIANHCYITKEGFTGRMERLEGFGGFRWAPEIPRRFETIATTKVKAWWTFNGKEHSIGVDPDDICEIPCKVDKYTSIDAILGKVERKLRARIFQRVTGITLPEGDAEDSKVKPIEVKVSSTDALQGEKGDEKPKEAVSRTEKLKGDLRKHFPKAKASEGQGKTLAVEEDLFPEDGPETTETRDSRIALSKTLKKQTAQRKARMKEAEAEQPDPEPEGAIEEPPPPPEPVEEAGESPETSEEPPEGTSYRVKVTTAYTGEFSKLAGLLKKGGLKWVQGGEWDTDLLEASKAVEVSDYLHEIADPENPSASSIDGGKMVIQIFDEETGELAFEVGKIKTILKR